MRRSSGAGGVEEGASGLRRSGGYPGTARPRRRSRGGRGMKRLWHRSQLPYTALDFSWSSRSSGSVPRAGPGRSRCWCWRRGAVVPGLRGSRASGVPAAGRHRADAEVAGGECAVGGGGAVQPAQEPVRAAGRACRGGGARPGRGTVPGGRGGPAAAPGAGRSAAGGGGSAVHGGVRAGDPPDVSRLSGRPGSGHRRARVGAWEWAGRAQCRGPGVVRGRGGLGGGGGRAARGHGV